MAELPVLIDQQRRETPRGPALPRATEDAFGGRMSRGYRGLQSGLDDVAQAAENIDQRMDAADARERDNLYSQRERDLLYGEPEVGPDGQPMPGTGGYLNRLGRNAIDSREQVEADLRAYALELSEGSRSGRSRAAFTDLNNRRLETTLDQMARHNASQLLVYEDAQSEAAISSARDAAVAGWSDPEIVNGNINAIIQHTQEIARRRGIDGDALTQMVTGATSSARAAVVVQMADNDPSMAQEVFTRWRGSMTADDVTTVNRAIHGVVLADRARTMADDFMAQAGGDYRRFLELAEGVDNTELQEAIITRGANVADSREAVERRDADNAEERAWTALTSGRSVRAADRALLVAEGRWPTMMSQMRSMAQGSGQGSEALRHELLGMSQQAPTLFLQVVDLLQNRIPVSLQQRMPANLDEAGQASWIDQELQRTTGYTRGEWTARRSAMTWEDWNPVFEQSQVLRGDRPVSPGGSRLTEQAYTDLLQYVEPLAAREGLVVDDPRGGERRNPEDRRRIGRFQAAVRAEADAYVRTYGEVPSREQMRSIANRLLLRVQDRQGSWFGNYNDDSALRGFDVGPGMRDNEGRSLARVPYARIPREDRQMLEDRWEASNPESTDVQAMRDWVEQQFIASLERY